MIEEKSYFTGKVSLNYAEIPNHGKPLVLLLHGGSARWQGLERVMRDLSAKYHVVAPDLRGHGQSDKVWEAYRLADFADDIESFIHSINQPLILIGHSLGGQLALMVAARMPELIKALIIGDAPLTLDNLREIFVKQTSMIKIWIRLAGKAQEDIFEALKDVPVIWGEISSPRPAREVFEENSPWFEQMAANLSHHDPTMLTIRLEKFDSTHEGFKLETLLPCISCPTLLLQGDPKHGGLLTDSEVELAKQLLAKPYHRCLEGVGHGLFHENFEMTMMAIHTFLVETELE